MDDQRPEHSGWEREPGSDAYGMAPDESPTVPSPALSYSATVDRSHDTGSAVATRPIGTPSMAHLVTAPPSQDGKRRWLRRRSVQLVLILLCFVLGYGGVIGAVTLTDAFSAAKDAKAQVATIQSIVHTGHLSDVATLTQVQNHLHALESDLRRIQSDLPTQAAVSGAVHSTSMFHVLMMAQDLTEAGLAGVDAGMILLPHVKDLTSSLSSPPGASGATSATHASAPTHLTLDDVHRAATDLNTAGALVSLALQERAHVRDSDLQALGFGSLVSSLHKLDALAPTLPTYLTYARQIAASLPDLLGLTKPANFLIFDLDSDELRPGGGFQGVYGIVTLKNAQLASKVALRNVYQIDCTYGYGSQCVLHSLPSRFDWFPYHDGLRNANLDPDYPTSALLNERMLALDGGPAVSGVISITPAVVEQALALTGPLTVPGYPQKLTAQNFRELIHYYHGLAGAANITKTKAFDAAAATALLQAFAHLSQQNQTKLGLDLVHDLSTRDLQLYFNDARLESFLTSQGLDGALRRPSGDTFMVVNANGGANYANTDVTATESDRITLDAQGTATHTLTISYSFHVKPHMYPSKLVGYYRDVIQVIVPAQATLKSLHGCAPVTITEPGWADWACDMLLFQGQSATVQFQWTTPHVTSAAHGGSQYNLLVQHQAGSHDYLAVTITPPPGARFIQSAPKSLALASPQLARYAALLTENTPISVTWSSS